MIEAEEEIEVACRWRHLPPTVVWLIFGSPQPELWYEVDNGKNAQWYPFWIRLLYCIDYFFFRCRLNILCHRVDQIQLDYRKKHS